jgi:hypothetical protein
MIDAETSEAHATNISTPDLRAQMGQVQTKVPLAIQDL